MSGATAAILLPATATSIGASMLFLGSIRWPPLSTRSYWARAAAHRNRATMSLRTDDPLLGFIPGHIFSFPVGLHTHLAGHHAIVSQHAIAFERLVGSNGRVEVVMVERQIFRARFLVHDGLHVLGEGALRRDGEAGLGELQRGLVAADDVVDRRIVGHRGEQKDRWPAGIIQRDIERVGNL